MHADLVLKSVSQFIARSSARWNICLANLYGETAQSRQFKKKKFPVGLLK